jgi:hypothetical protein
MRQEDQEFQANLSYIMRPCLNQQNKTKQTNKNKEEEEAGGPGIFKRGLGLEGSALMNGLNDLWINLLMNDLKGGSVTKASLALSFVCIPLGMWCSIPTRDSAESPQVRRPSLGAAL